MPWRLDKLMYSPVFEDEAEDEHESAESPEHRYWRNFAIVTVSYPQPPEEEHGKPIYRP